MYIPKHLKKWTGSSNYGGEDLSEWYCLAGRTRDSYLLENNNFEQIEKHLEEQGFEISGLLEETEKSTGILKASFGHWACGWIEELMIHESNEQGLILADEIKAAIDDYPIFDEDSYYKAESEMIFDYVKEYTVKEWMDEHNMEYDNDMLDSITSQLTQSHDFEINGYDEVVSANSVTDEDMESAIQYVKENTK